MVRAGNGRTSVRSLTWLLSTHRADLGLGILESELCERGEGVVLLGLNGFRNAFERANGVLDVPCNR